MCDILTVDFREGVTEGRMFIQLDGKKAKRIVLNTTYIECIRKTVLKEDFLLVFCMTSGERIKLFYSDEGDRDSDFKCVTDALCYSLETMDPRFIMNYYKFVARSETHAYVQGENYDAVEITNSHDKDKNRNSFNICNKE